MDKFIDPSKRFRLYFDETGNGDLDATDKSPNERYLSLTGVVIRQDYHDRYTTRRLNRLKREIFKNEAIVLHRRDIMRKEGAFSALRNDQLRKEFDARFAAMIAEIPARAFTVSIDKKEHRERYKVWHFSPYHYVLTCLAERFVLWLNRTNNIGDIMGEARDPTHDGKLRRSFRRFYDEGTTVRTDVIRARLTSREIKLEPKTANIAGLQVADLLAHPCHRALKFEKLKEPLPDDYGAFVSSLVNQRIHDRNHNTNLTTGWGTKWLP